MESIQQLVNMLAGNGEESIPPSKKKAIVVSTATKRAQAIEIYKASINEGRSVVIGRYRTELGMTDAGASSYFYATKKLCKQE